MSLNTGKHIPIYIYNSGHSRKGHGVGGIFKGWLKRTIPIIKSKVLPTVKRLGKDVAVQVLDSGYTAGRDMLVGKKDQSADDQSLKDVGNYKFSEPLYKMKSRKAKKAIKRKKPSKSISRIRNVKRKRPNYNLSDGFRNVTL